MGPLDPGCEAIFNDLEREGGLLVDHEIVR